MIRSLFYVKKHWSWGRGGEEAEGRGQGEALCIVEKQWRGGDQSEHDIDMHKNQIHSLKAEYRILQHKQVSHLTHQFGDDKL